MDYNREFGDTMDSINDIGKEYGFVNGIAWAEEAQRRGKITYSQFMKYKNAHNLRVRFSHGNAKDIKVSFDTYQIVKNYERDIRHSSIRLDGSHGKYYSRRKPKLPSGTFRGRPFIKEFRRTGKDGEEYHFRFEICKENNYLDDGMGGTAGFGYFIHIIDAPYFSYASQRPHEFHIITTNYDYHICWDKVISGFEEANAVMFVWVNRYVELIEVVKRDKTISERKLLKMADKKHVLPSGTFRGKTSGKKNCRHYQRKTIYIMQKIYDQIMSVLGKRKPELGGMLGFTIDQDTIDNYVFDGEAMVNSVEYNPNIEYLQKVIEGEWQEKHISLGGFVHSHPGDFNLLSTADVEYAKRIMKAFELKYLFMPIVTSDFEYKASITGYIVYLNGKVERCNIEVVPGEESVEENIQETEIDPELLKRIEAEFDGMEKAKGIEVVKSIATPSVPETADDSEDNIFARISPVIDIPYLSECTIIGIGCGGEKSFYESMAKMGVCNFYLMDGDRATYSNIASQNGYLSEVGMYKPELIKKRLLDINPKINVSCFDRMLDDDMDDGFLEKEILDKVDKKKTVLCAFTDNFYAQARISRIALKNHIPFLCGQHHERGMVFEAVFWYPGLTKYSLREIARTRYLDYEGGYRNTVTSCGSPIFNTTRLNALCEKIALGMLIYAGYPDHVYCSFLNRMGNKNLILVRQSFLDPNHPLSSFFDNSPDSLFDDVVWVNPEDIEELKDVPLEEGTVEDTRTIFRK